MKREDYISDETVIKRANEAVRLELEKNKALYCMSCATDSNTEELPLKSVISSLLVQ